MLPQQTRELPITGGEGCSGPVQSFDFDSRQVGYRRRGTPLQTPRGTVAIVRRTPSLHRIERVAGHVPRPLPLSHTLRCGRIQPATYTVTD